jgi:hypothetical protein
MSITPDKTTTANIGLASCGVKCLNSSAVLKNELII